VIREWGNRKWGNGEMGKWENRKIGNGEMGKWRNRKWGNCRLQVDLKLNRLTQ